MASKKCDRHHGMNYFKVGEEWRCSGCGKVERWSDSWGYYGMMSCFKCRCEPAIEFVACSDACMAKFNPEEDKADPFADIKREELERNARDAAIININAKIAKLAARRDELQKR